MINIVNTDTVHVTAFGKIISKIVYGGKVVWEVIRSCFGSGYWVNNRSWINSDGWKNR